MSSCSEDDTLTVDFPTTDVRLNVATVESRTNVNREDIPATVESIDVTVTSQETNIVRNESYTLVDDGSGVNGFVVEQVALGQNEVEASTTTVATATFEVTTFSGNVNDKLQDNKERVPYALYTGSDLVDVTGVNDFFNISMLTDNGRTNTVIELAEAIADEYMLQVTSYTTEDSPQVVVGNVGDSVSVYWSSNTSVEGKEVVYDINVIAPDGSVVFNTVQTQTVVGSTGINTLITVSDSDVQSESEGFSFSFEPWTEVDGN